MTSFHLQMCAASMPTAKRTMPTKFALRAAASASQAFIPTLLELVCEVFQSFPMINCIRRGGLGKKHCFPSLVILQPVEPKPYLIRRNFRAEPCAKLREN